MSESGQIYLPGLNGLRALAASFVIYSHVSLILPSFGLPATPPSQLAGFGVTLFFALSGYLITLLLFLEMDRTGTLSVGRFYLRRILRIWPLYYLYLALVTIPALVAGTGVGGRLLAFYVLFAPNVPYAYGAEIHLAGHYWSLGVEEQFYLIWPWLLLLWRRAQPWGPACFVLAFLALKAYLNLRFGGLSEPYTLAYVTRFSCMAIGGMGAWVHLRRPSLGRALSAPWAQAAAWMVLVAVALNRFHVLSILDHELVAVVTVVIIFGQVMGSTPLVRLEGGFLNMLGQRSYGLYVYHPAVMVAVRWAWPGALVGWGGTALVFAAVCGLTLLVAHLSFEYLERPFLRRKARLAVVPSRTAPAGVTGS